MTGGLSLPKIGFGQLTAAVKLADGRATFEKLEAKGGDAELQADGLYFVVQPRMEFAPISGKAKVKVQDAFWSKSGTQGFRSMADAALASARGPDGAWTFSVTGSVGHPRMQPVGGGAPPAAFGAGAGGGSSFGGAPAGAAPPPPAAPEAPAAPSRSRRAPRPFDEE